MGLAFEEVLGRAMRSRRRKRRPLSPVSEIELQNIRRILLEIYLFSAHNDAKQLWRMVEGWREVGVALGE